MFDKINKVKFLIVICFIIFFTLLPLVFNLSSYVIHLMILAGIYILLAQGLNILSGYVGELSLGHQAFYGIGAYASALLTFHLGLPFLLSFIGAGIIAGFINWLISKVSFRLRGFYFIIVTLCFAEITRIIVLSSHDLTGGPYGLRNIPGINIFGYEFTTRLSYYYLLLIIVAIVLLVSYRIINSRIGRNFLAMREAEQLARTVGINTVKRAILASVISGVFAGFAGSFYAHYTTFISTDLLNFDNMVTLLIILTLGGKGSFIGPIIGSFIIIYLQEYLRFIGEWRLVILGIILVLTVLYFPDGIGNKIEKMFKNLNTEAS